MKQIKKHWFGYTTGDSYTAGMLLRAEQDAARAAQHNPLIYPQFQASRAQYLERNSTPVPALWGLPRKIKSLLTGDSN